MIKTETKFHQTTHSILNVPNLRFPGFSKEWERHRIGELCSFFSGGTPSSSNKEYYGGTIPFIRSGEIHSDYTDLFLSEEGYKNSSAKMVEVGDVLLALYGANSGDIAISKIHGAINQAILCIRTNMASVFFKSVWEKHTQKILDTYLQGGQGNLSAEIVKKIFIYLPAYDEQLKLATFISKLEERITIQNKVIEKYESLIKALSYEIIGCKEPNTTLADCVKCTSSTLKEGDLLDEGQIPAYGASGISGYTNISQSIGDSILITKDGSGVGSLRYVHGNHSFVGTLNSLNPKEGIYLPYIYYALQNVNLGSYKTGQAIPHIYFKDYGKEALFCPSYDTQKELANGLELLEVKKENESIILCHLKSIKAYLLKEMFI